MYGDSTGRGPSKEETGTHRLQYRQNSTQRIKDQLVSGEGHTTREPRVETSLPMFRTLSSSSFFFLES